MPTIIFWNTSNNQINSIVKGKNTKVFSSKPFISVDDDIVIDLTFDKVVNNQLVFYPEENKNILDKIYLDEFNILHNVPLGAKVWVNGECYFDLQSPIQLEPEFNNTTMKIRVTMLPHREWKNYE